MPPRCITQEVMEPNLNPTAETTIPEGCAVCGGDLHLRVTSGKAISYCAICHWIARPTLQVLHQGLKVAFTPKDVV
jgi:hypothetical protein